MRGELFQRTSDVLMKLLPLTVSVKAGPPAWELEGLRLLMTGVGLFICMLTAAAASIMPAPQVAVVHLAPVPVGKTGKARAVDCMRKRTWAGVRAGFIDSISDAIPDTCGAAMLVPW